MSVMDSPPAGATLVIGLGELGSSVLAALSRHPARRGEELSVLLRPSHTPQRRSLRSELAAQGITIVEADVGTAPVAELSTLMSPFHTVVCCVGFAAGPGTQMRLAHAALAAGIQRYVPWQFGADYDTIGYGSPQNLFDEQLDVRNLLRAQSVTEWVIVSTGMFTSFLFDRDLGVVDLASSTVNALGSWDTEVTVTTAEDIGVLTAEILHARPAIANQVVYVAGDTISYRTLADIVERVADVPVTRNEWTVAHLLDDLARNPDDAMRKYRAVFGQGIGVAWPKAETYNAIHGLSTSTAEQWARGNLATESRP
jgi:hypothetical protein